MSPAGFKPAVSSHSNHAAIELVRTEGVAPSWACARRLLGPARLLFRHVRKIGSGTETCAPLFPIPGGRVATYALPAKLVEAGGLAPPESKGRRVYSALQLLLCHASKTGGSGGTCTRIDTAYETVAQLLCYRARMVGRPGNAPDSAG